MDMTTLLILVFGAAIIALLLLLLRRPSASADQGSEEREAIKANAASWEARWKEDRQDFDRKEADLRAALDEEKEAASLLRSKSVRLETELQAAKDRLHKEEQDKEEK